MANGSRRPKGDGSLFRRHAKEYGCPKAERADDGTRERPAHKCKAPWAGRVAWTDDDGRERVTQVSDRNKKEAGDKLGKLLERVADGDPPKDAAMSFETYAAEWVTSSLEASQRKDSTKRLYRERVKHQVAGSALGRMSLRDIRPRHVEAWIVELRGRGLASSTIRGAYQVAREVAACAVRDKLLADNPFTKVKAPTARTESERTALTKQQVRLLLAALGNSRHLEAVTLLVNTGLRVGELLALRWEEVDLSGRELRVRFNQARTGELVEPKTKRSRRTVPLNAAAVIALESVQQRTEREREAAGSKWVGADRVFLTELGAAATDHALRDAMMWALDRGLGDQLGLERIGPHMLRHTFATLLLQDDVPLMKVSRLLGHSSVSITADIYGHVKPEDHRDALDTLADL